MHEAAKLIARDRGGSFPGSAEEWLDLPGIGRYTASAIASIAFDEPVPVVDGNVQRVLERLLGKACAGKLAWVQAEKLLDRTRPGDFNQAMMELGATVCTPRAPQCLICPVHSFCRTRGAAAPGPQPGRKIKNVCYGMARLADSVLLVQRDTQASLMAGMWELPVLAPEVVNGDEPLMRLRHSITDTDYRVSVYAVAADRIGDLVDGARWFTLKQCKRLALTGLARKVLRKLGG
jgi:A/G-specific adenine glycosylase